MKEGQRWRSPLRDIRNCASGGRPAPASLYSKHKDLRLPAGDLVRLFSEVAKINSDEQFRFDPLDLFQELLARQRERSPSDLERKVIQCLANGFPRSKEGGELEIVIEALTSGNEQDSLDELITVTWIGEEPSAILEFPVATVLGGKGMITTMRLRIWRKRKSGILPDIEHYHREIVNNVGESAEFARQYSGASGLISWSIPELESETLRGNGNQPAIAGPSRSAAILRALWLHQNGKKVDPRLLVIGAVDKDGHLVEVGEIAEKTKAAVVYTRKAIIEGRTPIDRIAIVGSEEVAMASTTIAANQATDLIDVVELDPESLIPQSTGG
jgi:hypothetical protein